MAGWCWESGCLCLFILKFLVWLFIWFDSKRFFNRNPFLYQTTRNRTAIEALTSVSFSTLSLSLFFSFLTSISSFWSCSFHSHSLSPSVPISLALSPSLTQLLTQSHPKEKQTVRHSSVSVGGAVCQNREAHTYYQNNSVRQQQQHIQFLYLHGF